MAHSPKLLVYLPPKVVFCTERAFHRRVMTSQKPERESKQAPGVRFSDVTLLHYEVELDGSKLPSDGLAPIGLGELQHTELRRLESYEHERAVTRAGVGHVPVEKRRQVIGLTRVESTERVEKDNTALKLQHARSFHEHIRDIRAQREAELRQAKESAGALSLKTPPSPSTPIDAELTGRKRLRQSQSQPEPTPSAPRNESG